MATIKCFFLEETGDVAQSLRRYVDERCSVQNNKYAIHDAFVRIENGKVGVPVPKFLDDPRWPKQCNCGYIFTDKAAKQVFCDPIYKRSDTGEFIALRDAPAGAMYYADWMLSRGFPSYAGPDGHSLAVKTPGGIWMIDSRAKNCDKPNDNVHKCWVRHGVPPLITVDKNGITCNAGAGSIQCGKYHGFLRNGELVEC